ncbi:unnamed protein product [Symbiodinium sp. CCMP2592]|nr:unnamed protein product [Symbiodinium sp. CCMP2592]
MRRRQQWPPKRRRLKLSRSGARCLPRCASLSPSPLEALAPEMKATASELKSNKDLHPAPVRPLQTVGGRRAWRTSRQEPLGRSAQRRPFLPSVDPEPAFNFNTLMLRWMQCAVLRTSRAVHHAAPNSAAPEVLQSFTELVERSSVVPEVAPEAEAAAEARVAEPAGSYRGRAGPQGGFFAGRLPQPRKRPPPPLEALRSVT